MQTIGLSSSKTTNVQVTGSKPLNVALSAIALATLSVLPNTASAVVAGGATTSVDSTSYITWRSGTDNDSGDEVALVWKDGDGTAISQGALATGTLIRFLLVVDLRRKVHQQLLLVVVLRKVNQQFLLVGIEVIAIQQARGRMV
ncbi:hypothetical protein [Avibacterium avium]|uniref:hypothetical protein n=1 Tax=Avibacterium avium TaxID=751 RepID=UPI003BF8D136